MVSRMLQDFAQLAQSRVPAVGGTAFRCSVPHPDSEARRSRMAQWCFGCGRRGHAVEAVICDLLVPGGQAKLRAELCQRVLAVSGADYTQSTSGGRGRPDASCRSPVRGRCSRRALRDNDDAGASRLGSEPRRPCSGGEHAVHLARHGGA